MDRLTSIWKDLLSQQPHSIFQRFSWNRLAAEMFADRLSPYVVCVDGDHGAAIIPAAVHPLNNRIEFIGEALFDYRDVLHSGDPETLRHAWQQLAMLDLPLQVVAIGPAASRRNWGGFNLTPFAAAPWVDRGSIEPSEFRMAHPRLGRQMRRLRKRGAELRLYGGQDSAVVRRLYQCKSSKFTASANLNLFLESRRREFMIEAARLEAGDCKIYALEQAEELVAAVLTFRDGGIRRFYTIYFDPAWAHYSPGQALLFEATALSLEEGLSCDYMTGAYPYKLRLANTSSQLFRADLGSGELAELTSRASVIHAA